MRKLGGWVVAILVFAVSSLVAAEVLLVAGTFFGMAFLDYSERAARNVESAANILALVIGYFPARMSYKRIVRGN